MLLILLEDFGDKLRNLNCDIIESIIYYSKQIYVITM